MRNKISICRCYLCGRKLKLISISKSNDIRRDCLKCCLSIYMDYNKHIFCFDLKITNNLYIEKYEVFDYELIIKDDFSRLKLDSLLPSKDFEWYNKEAMINFINRTKKLLIFQ